MSKRLTQDQFLEKSNIKHSNKFDYSKSIYVNYDTDIIIICPVHGEFVQKAGKHLCGDGCAKCAGHIQLDTKEFIERSIRKHGNRFNYKKSIYVNQKTKVEIICKKHGSFWQMPSSHYLNGATCLKCSNEERSLLKTKSNIEFINEAKKKHGEKYTYQKTKYKDSYSYVIITCKKHGDFKINANSLLSGCGCGRCAIEENSDKLRSNIDDFKNKAISVHGKSYNYDSCIYIDCKTKMKILCNKHEEYFYQTANSHLRGSGCPICKVDNTGWSRSKFENHCKKGGVATLYLLECFHEDERFFKIGITSRTIKTRFSKHGKETTGTHIPYDFDVLSETKGDPSYVWDMEKTLHRKLKGFRYKPNNVFGGHTECFSELTQEVKDFFGVAA